jgi:hypothetical protein
MKSVIFAMIAMFGIAAAAPAFAASVSTVNSSRIAPNTVTLASAGANEGGLNGGDPHQVG